jgi:hypothetical protein
VEFSKLLVKYMVNEGSGKVALVGYLRWMDGGEDELDDYDRPRTNREEKGVSSRREWENPGRQRQAEGGRWIAEVNAAVATELWTRPRKRVPTWIVMARVKG